MATQTDIDWDEKFTIVPTPDQLVYWELSALTGAFGEILPEHANKVWTVVEAEGDLYVTPGIHFVNRVNGTESYVLTEEPATEADYGTDWAW